MSRDRMQSLKFFSNIMHTFGDKHICLWNTKKVHQNTLRQLHNNNSMSVVGSLIFCTDCGNLMGQITSDEDVDCDQCKASFPSKGEYWDLWLMSEGLGISGVII